MPSQSALKRTNIIVLAKNHNPTIVSKEWLFAKQVITEEVKQFASTPVFSMVETAELVLTVDQNRLMIAPKVISDGLISRLPEVVKRYVDQLPETPYNAVGFNFHYDLPHFEWDNLFTPKERFMALFPAETPNLGAIAKYHVDDFTVTLTISPDAGNQTVDFNFNRSSSESQVITEALEHYADALAETARVMGGLEHR